MKEDQYSTWLERKHNLIVNAVWRLKTEGVNIDTLSQAYSSFSRAGIPEGYNYKMADEVIEKVMKYGVPSAKEYFKALVEEEKKL